MENESRRFRNRKIRTAPAVIVIAVAIALLAYLLVSFKTQSDRAWRQSNAVAAGRAYAEVGQEASLKVGLVAIDRPSLRDALDALESDRKGAFSALHISGRIFSVVKQTRVLILENTDAESRVRIVDGKYHGIEGWISDDWIE
jgi:hypothetical protein